MQRLNIKCMASIRITLNNEQQVALKDLLEEVLHGYYSQANIDEIASFEERIEAMCTQIHLQNILNKLK